MKKLSVIIPVRNDKRVINAINSIIDSEDIEIIVIDGESTDGTKELLNDINDRLTYFVSEKDNGFYDAVNKGIKLSNAEWIFVLASDDILLLNPLDVISSSEFSKCDIICGSVVEHIEDDKYRINISKSNLDELRYDCTLRHPASFFKASIYEKIGFYDDKYKCAGDREFFLRAYMNGLNIKVFDDAVVLFEFGGLSTGRPLQYVLREDTDISKKYGASYFKIIFYVLQRVAWFYGHKVKECVGVKHRLEIYDKKEIQKLLIQNEKYVYKGVFFMN